MDHFLSHLIYEQFDSRALSDITRSAAPRVLYLIKHSCSYIKYYLLYSRCQKYESIPFFVKKLEIRSYPEYYICVVIQSGNFV